MPLLPINNLRNIPRIAMMLAWLSAGEKAAATDYLRMAEVREMRLGGTGVMVAAMVNPSLVAEEEKRSATFSVVDNYGVKGLTRLTAGMLYPNEWLPAAVHIETFGFDAYRETMFQGAVGRRLGGGWTLGIAVRYSVLQTELFDERGTCLSADAGCRFAPTEEWATGFSLMNIAAVAFGEGAKGMSSSKWRVEAGMKWMPVEKLRLLGSIAGGRDAPVGGHMGIEYDFEKRFTVSGGIGTAPWMTALGVGYEGRLFAVDVATTVHPVLGMSWGIGFSVYF
jgi:hypothetical protein